MSALIAVTDLRRSGDGHRYIISAARGNVVLPLMRAQLHARKDELPPSVVADEHEDGLQIDGLTAGNRVQVEAVLIDAVTSVRTELASATAKAAWEAPTTTEQVRAAVAAEFAGLPPDLP